MKLKPARSIRCVLAALIPFASVILALTYAEPSVAQDKASEATGSEVSLYVGSMLPNQIDGVDEVLPVFGGRYGLGLGFATAELGVANSHASGIDFTTGELSLRTDMPLGGGLAALLYGGLDMNYYSPVHSVDRRTDYGAHVGAAATMAVGSDLSLRTDLKFMGGPGVSLYLLFGFAIKL